MNRFKISCKIALISFGIGTILFVLQAINRGLNSVTIIGYYYVGLALIINSLVLLILLFTLFLKKTKIETVKSMGILLLNIPIAFLYYLIVIHNLI
ncbi:hypothetical protein [Flavivirga jejuensis]|uniref:Branched-chain amino acid:cation transporter, LIVCS family n=1 Tax=Flavivirga jejuensis TaxID=870487 RepID=A0ABT8WK55_9FLAO|nr:hypothetical protein [Flavivirga jejuensis]MDO5973545.1 hypothetical protein [Flavivirga jejuensis]